MHMKIKLLAFTLIVTTLGAEAQSFYSTRRNRNLLISFGSGTANYFGEMVNPGEFGTLKPNIAIGAEYYFGSRISVRGEVVWFQLSGDDAKANDDRKERNLSFRSDNFEASMVGVVNLVPAGIRFYQRPFINFHGFAGVGVLRFNPKAEYQGKMYALAPLETEGVKYSRIVPVIPFGLGIRVKVTPFFNILLEGGYRKTFTDYLDDVSARKYPDPATLKSDLSRALSDRRKEIGIDLPYTKGIRGNPDSDDSYFIANVSVQYYVPGDLFSGGNKASYKAKRKSYYKRAKRR